MKSKLVVLLALLSLPACMAQPLLLPRENLDYSRILLEQINLYRMNNGLNSLRIDPVLGQLAKEHSSHMFQRKRISHRNFDERSDQAGSCLCVENVGWNYDSPLKLFDDWQRSRGHNRNMLKMEITRVGIAETGKYVTFFACR
ncbi:MAG: CAP domain-containing protein [Desulfobulbaceae bacterium]|nr:MAG: CAP domain-containing protein [Desulfobulbaceae bacterium]